MIALACTSAVIAAPNPLLGVQTGNPDIFFKSGVNQGCSYDGTTLTIAADASTLQMLAGVLPIFFDNGVVTITADIDGNGGFSSGTLNVSGTVGTYGNPVLTGTISDYGIADFGATDRIEFTFNATGGSLFAPFEDYGGGIAVALEGSAYTGTFVADAVDAPFCTVAKGNISPTPLPPVGTGTGTIGYWKNHPDAWTMDYITIGDVTYSKSEAIAILNVAVRGDKTLSMAKQLIAAILNVDAGNDDSCILDTIDAANTWLINHGGVGSGQRQWDNGDLLHDELDAYNNGLLCAPHRG